MATDYWDMMAQQESGLLSSDLSSWDGEAFNYDGSMTALGNVLSPFSVNNITPQATETKNASMAATPTGWATPTATEPAKASSFFGDMSAILQKGASAVSSAFGAIFSPTKTADGKETYGNTVYAAAIAAGATAIMSYMNSKDMNKAAASRQEDTQAFERETKALEYKREDDARARKNRVSVRRGLLSQAAGPVVYQNPITQRGY